jgi:probable HAF family extracellular repeat protein
MADLGTLGGLESIAFAVNASGQVTGNTEIGGLASHAFLYTGTPGAGGTMADLGSLGGSYSTGNAVNARGQVAGMSYMADDYTRHAFLYTGTPGTDGHMIDLDAWLDVVNPIEGAKWTLFEAEGLTDTGLITGYGFYTGGESSTMCAFLLDASSLVPEPTTLSLLALGGLAMLRRKRR